jgi:hypothetical protein
MAQDQGWRTLPGFAALKGMQPLCFFLNIKPKSRARGAWRRAQGGGADLETPAGLSSVKKTTGRE